MLHRYIVCLFRRHEWEQVVGSYTGRIRTEREVYCCKRCHAVKAQ